MNEPEMLTSEDCEAAARKCLKSDDFRVVNFATIGLQNENFLVEITVNHDFQEKTLHLFAKSSSEVPRIHKILDDFKKALPDFEPKITPKLYFWKPDLLLFEDLTWQGFQTQQGFFSLEEMKCALKVLAKFHAASFAYEEIKSQELGKKYRLDEEYTLVGSNINLQETDVKNMVSSIIEDGAAEKIIEDFEARQFSRKHRKILCHSNLIPGNIMFKNENGVPVECKLINFKSKHYAPPIYDVLQLIFFNSSQDFRQHYLEEVISDYHSFLKKELENYCLKIEKILTADELQLAFHEILPLLKLEALLKYGQKATFLTEFKEIVNCSVLSREECYVIARNKTETSDYKFLSFTVTHMAEVNGFLGDYFRLKIKIYHRDEEKTLNFFIKQTPESEAAKGTVEETGCFSKETFIYQTLVPQMRSLGIYTLDECLPASYFQRSEDLIVFEDISSNGFEVLPAQIPFDFDLLCLVLKKLAKFHASVIMFEEKMSEKIGKQFRMNEEYGRYISEIFFLKDATHKGARLMQAGVRSIIDLINLFPELKTAKNQKNFNTTWPKLQDIFFSVTQPSDRFRNVLNHGDLWSSNIMVQLNDGKPSDCRFIDYQCTRYCPPAHDYLSVLYLSSDRTIRMKYEENLQQIYHNELSKILSSYSYNIEEIHPYEDFVESVKCIKPQMIMQAVQYCSFGKLPAEHIASYFTNDDICNKVWFGDRKEFLESMTGKSSVYKNKLKECVLDLYDMCDLMCSEL